MQLKERDIQEKADAERCQQRLQHLKAMGQPGKDQVLDWNRQRLPRILTDHLLRSDYTETASLLTDGADLQVGYTIKFDFVDSARTMIPNTIPL